MSQHLLIIAYGITIMGSSLAGGYLPGLVQLTHVRMQMLLSFVGGLMLGVAVLHLIPDGITKLDIPEVPGVQHLDFAMGSLLLGLLVSFLMMRAFHFHHHGEEPTVDASTFLHVHGKSAPKHHDHVHHHEHIEKDEGPHEHSRPTGDGSGGGLFGKDLGWMGMVFGLSLHTFIDGVALGSAVLSDFQHGKSGPLFGFATYLAILLHKPLDAMSLTSLILARGGSLRHVQWLNLGVTALCPLGAICVLKGMVGSDIALGCLLTSTAGVFLCIALSDLLPEVQFHQHDRLPLSAALLVGIGVAVGLEAFHTH